jgi:hypothetical protein
MRIAIHVGTFTVSGVVGAALEVKPSTKSRLSKFPGI